MSEERAVAWTADQVAVYCGLDRATVYRLARLGEIPHGRAGRSVRFHPEAIDAWLKGEWKRDQQTA